MKCAFKIPVLLLFLMYVSASVASAQSTTATTPKATTANTPAVKQHQAAKSNTTIAANTGKTTKMKGKKTRSRKHMKKANAGTTSSSSTSGKQEKSIATPAPHQNNNPSPTPATAVSNKESMPGKPIAKPATQPKVNAAGDKLYGKDAKGHQLYQDARGGVYYSNADGSKVFVKKDSE